MGVVTCLFIIIFKPSNIDEYVTNLTSYATIAGLLVSGVLLFYFFIITKLFPNYFDNKTWTIGKHIFTVTGLMLLGSVVYWVYKNNIANDVVSFRNVVSYVFSIGIFPLLIYLFIDERTGTYQRKKIIDEIKKEKKLTKPVTVKNKNQPLKPNYVTIYSYNEKDSLHFDVTKLVYITSEVNYACFFLLEKGDLRELIIRKPLSQIELDLQEYSNIVRCHKSYFVNTNYIKNIRGNARGYYLDVEFNDNEIPVSRKFKKTDLELLIS